MSSISAVVLTYNEETNIENCLKTLSFCDEIVIVDSGSTDNTLNIANKYTKNVYSRSLDNFAKQRQYGASVATKDWVLYVDADEYIPQELAHKLLELKARITINTIIIPRKNLFMGKLIKHSGWYPDWQRRMIRRNKVQFIEKSVHELPELIDEVIEINSDWDKNQAIIHTTYSSLENYIKKINLYTSLEALDLKDSLRVNKLDVIFRSFGMFWQCYFQKKAYKDGIAGFIISVIQMIYSLMLMIKIIEIKSNEN